MNYMLATAADIVIGQYAFWGPYTSSKYLHAEPGVFVILDLDREGTWTVLDVDVSPDVRDGVERHERRACWANAAHGRVAVAAISSRRWPMEECVAIAEEIRSQFQPPCGA